MQVVGIVLVRNEDVFVEQAIRNVAGFCDRDLRRRPRLDRRNAGDPAASSRTSSTTSTYVHVQAMRAFARVIEPYAGTETWVLGVDGDELYDPSGARTASVPTSRPAHTPTCSG